MPSWIFILNFKPHWVYLYFFLIVFLILSCESNEHEFSIPCLFDTTNNFNSKSPIQATISFICVDDDWNFLIYRWIMEIIKKSSIWNLKNKYLLIVSGLIIGNIHRFSPPSINHIIILDSWKIFQFIFHLKW